MAFPPPTGGPVRSPRLFYGWVVVAATFVLVAVGFGVLFSFGTYFEALSAEFAADRGAVSLIFSLGVLVYTFSGALTGPLTDRFGPRRLNLAAAVALAAGLFFAGRATALWQVYLAFGLGVGINIAAAQVPSISTVQRWFVRRRGLATSLAYSGVGVGTMVGPALSSLLIVGAGWRTAFLVMGLAGALLVAVAALFMVRSPAALSLAPDGDRAGVASGGGPALASGSERGLGEALQTSVYRAFYVAIVLSSIAFWIVFVHLVPAAQDAGLSAPEAALGLGGLGLGSTVGRLLLGPVGDRFGYRRSYALTTAIIAVSMVAWLVLPVRLIWPLALFGFVFGTAYGGFVALCPVILAEYFGTRAVSGILGFFYTGAGVGALAGPWLAGVIFDLTGSYAPAILFGAGTSALATLAILRQPDAARVPAG